MSRKQRNNLRLRFRSDQSGSVLLLVVWMLALLSFCVVVAAKNSFFALNVMQRFEKDFSAYPVARAGVAYAAQLVADDPAPEFDAFTDAFLRMSAEESRVSVGSGRFELFNDAPHPYTGRMTKTPGLLDEERKLNLNKADTDTLTDILRKHVTMKPEALAALVAKIEDWRDEDNEERKGGAEKYDYQTLKKPYDCKNGPFESLDEMLLIPGMTPKILEAIRPYMTVYGSGKVNLNTASREVMEALGLSEGAANIIMVYRLGPDGKEETADDPVFATTTAIQSELGLLIGAEDMNRIQQLIDDELVGVGSDAFSFTSLAAVPETGAEYRIDAVIHRSGEILSWKES